MLDVLEEIKELEKQLEQLLADLGDKRNELEIIAFQMGIRE